MSREPLSRKEEIWLACRQKTCCVKRLVTVTGRDVWRISRALNVDPWTFLLYFKAPPGPDTFILGHDDVQYRLALADEPSNRRSTMKPCIFLMRTRGGHHRCGLGQLRPFSCRVFPAQVADGVLYATPDTVCTCRRWALSDMDIEQERIIMDEFDDAREEYTAVLDGWNEFVRSTPLEQTFSLVDFCTVLMTMYDGIAANPELAGS